MWLRIGVVWKASILTEDSSTRVRSGPEAARETPRTEPVIGRKAADASDAGSQ